MHAPPLGRSFGGTQAQEHGANHIAPDCAGQNFYAIDRGLRDLVRLYLEPDDFLRLEPHFDRLGVSWQAVGSMNSPGSPTSTRRF
jgi:acyl-CoA dehydrogenase